MAEIKGQPSAGPPLVKESPAQIEKNLRALAQEIVDMLQTPSPISQEKAGGEVGEGPGMPASASDHLAAQQRMLAAIAELRSVQLTQEEEELLNGFETFRIEHPLHLASLTKES
ncbi:MAG TPA: hypothetical protein VGK45_08705 [Thermoanaerobaculia bacterium]